MTSGITIALSMPSAAVGTIRPTSPACTSAAYGLVGNVAAIAATSASMSSPRVALAISGASAAITSSGSSKMVRGAREQASNEARHRERVRSAWPAESRAPWRAPGTHRAHFVPVLVQDAISALALQGS